MITKKAVLLALGAGLIADRRLGPPAARRATSTGVTMERG